MEIDHASRTGTPGPPHLEEEGDDVDSIERFDQQALPAEVFARTGPERLRLVTCTGPYLPEAGGYQQNLVVTAVPV